MSYFGIRFKYKVYDFTINIHGTLERFEVDPRELEETALGILVNYTDDDKFNIMKVADKLADHITEIFCNGESMLWTEVHIQSNRMTCGSSVHKLDLVS